MARIRTIKPDFFTSLTIADLSVHARLTFVGLWTHADDEGRAVDDARLVKAAVWPLDDRTSADVDADLWELYEARLIQRYQVDGKPFLCVSGWGEHQRINRPTPSKHPAPEQGEPRPKPAADDGSLTTHGGLTEPSPGPVPAAREPSPGAPAEPPALPPVPVDGGGDLTGGDGVALRLVTSGDAASEAAGAGITEDSVSAQCRNREQGTGKGTGITTSPRSARQREADLEAEFQTWYGGYPLKKEPAKARKAYAKARKSATAQELLDGRDRYITRDRAVASGYVKYPATWLNQECWLDEHDTAPVARPQGSRPSTTDQRVSDAMALVAELEAEEQQRLHDQQKRDLA